MQAREHADDGFMKGNAVGQRPARVAAWSSCWRLVLVLLALTTGVMLAQGPADGALVETLGRTGVLRAAFLATNPVQATVAPATGAVDGPAADVARELGRRLGIPASMQPLAGVSAVMEAVRTGSADIGFLAYDATRAEQVAFTQAYILGHNSYVVRVDSPIRTIADADAEGVRIGARSGDAVDLFLGRTLVRAELVHLDRSTADEEAARLVLAGTISAYAANKQRLATVAGREPGVRVVDGSVLPVAQSIVVASEHRALVAALDRFIDELRASGILQRIVARHAIAGVEVAPSGFGVR